MELSAPVSILADYPLTVVEVRQVSWKPTRAVWWVKTQEGEYALKALRVSASRVGFLAAAHAYLQQASDLVPALLRTSHGRLFADDGTARYMVSEWVCGRPLVFSDPAELDLVCASLAALHRVSRGFRSPEGTEARNYLGRWPREYRERLAGLERLREVAEREAGLADRVFLAAFPEVRAQAEAAIDLLEASRYQEWCLAVESQGGLCHEDLATANTTLSRRGLKIFDLDALAVDLPARGLSRLLDRTFVLRGGWDESLLQTALVAYHRGHPLPAEWWPVLRADLMFPHLTCRAARKHYAAYYEGVRPDDRTVRRMLLSLSVEVSKLPVLQACFPEEGPLCWR